MARKLRMKVLFCQNSSSGRKNVKYTFKIISRNLIIFQIIYASYVCKFFLKLNWQTVLAVTQHTCYRCFGCRNVARPHTVLFSSNLVANFLMSFDLIMTTFYPWMQPSNQNLVKMFEEWVRERFLFWTTQVVFTQMKKLLTVLHSNRLGKP